MNSVPAQGAPNSYVRYIQENPSEVIKQMKSMLDIIRGNVYPISKYAVCKSAHKMLTLNYQSRMETSLELPFDHFGESA